MVVLNKMVTIIAGVLVTTVVICYGVYNIGGVNCFKGW